MIDNYNNLPIGMYLKIRKALDGAGDDIDKQVKVVAYLSGKTEDEVLHLPISEYSALARKADFLAGEAIDQPVRKEYNVAGWTLIPTTDYRKMETGQYIDFQSFLPDLDTYLVEFLSTMLVPKGKRYCEGYDIAEVQAAIRDHMTMGDAIPLTAFFFKSLETSIADILNFSESAAKEIRDKDKRKRILTRIAEVKARLRKSGDGSPTSTP